MMKWMEDEEFDIDSPPLKFFRMEDDVISPTFATSGAACFDIFAHIPPGTKIGAYDPWGEYYNITVGNNQPFVLEDGHRALIPTGLIFDIKPGWSVRLHARSGNSLKRGLVLANAEGIIDSDYVDPVFAIIINMGNINQSITHGTRICQGECVPVYNSHFNISETKIRPEPKTNRNGGFGSTGA